MVEVQTPKVSLPADGTGVLLFVPGQPLSPLFGSYLADLPTVGPVLQAGVIPFPVVLPFVRLGLFWVSVRHTQL